MSDNNFITTELSALARESVQRELTLGLLEAEVKALKKATNAKLANMRKEFNNLADFASFALEKCPWMWDEFNLRGVKLRLPED